MNIKRLFIFSCPQFGGFKADININDCETIKDIVNIMTNKLRDSLTGLNLELQVINLDKIISGYHIHDFSIEHILLNEGTYYICNHCLLNHEEMEVDDEVDEVEEMMYNFAIQ